MPILANALSVLLIAAVLTLDSAQASVNSPIAKNPVTKNIDVAQARQVIAKSPATDIQRSQAEPTHPSTMSSTYPYPNAIASASLSTPQTNQSSKVVNADIKQLIAVATHAEDGLIKRIPAAIKTQTGLLYFYHQQIAGFDGDLQGVELWKAQIAIDDNLNVKVLSRERFLSPDKPWGIVKHPMLGRTSDNRIILMYEKRLATSASYTRYQRFSSDEGKTWTEPMAVNPVGTNPAVLSALGTSGAITTAKHHRLIVPMYTYGGTCYVIYSDDNGMTWHYSEWLDPTKIQGFEPSITLDFDNNLIMTIRPKTPGQRLFAKSTDNGLTWQPMTVSPAVPSATTQGSIAKLTQANGENALVLSHAANPSEARTQFRLYVSNDNGQSYPVFYQPFDDNWYGGYSQIIQWLDRIYLIMFEYNQQFTAVNANENAGLLMLSSQEILHHLQPAVSP